MPTARPPRGSLGVVNGTAEGSALARRVRWTLVALVAVFIFGVLGYWLLEDWSLLDAT